MRNLSIATVCFCWILSGGSVVAQNPDFSQDVLPIFARNCFQCHGGGNREGQLNLESIAAIQRGGHSGSELLAEQLNESELYLRITSTADGYRMPKTGPGLSQEEIETLAQWIPMAATLPLAPDAAVPIALPFQRPAGLPAAVRSTDDAAAEFSLSAEMRMLLASAAVVGLAMVWLMFRMLKKRRRWLAKKPIEQQLAIANGQWWLLAIPSLMVSGLLCYGTGHFYLSTQQLVDQNQKLQVKVDRARQPDGVAPIEVNANTLPLPPHPMHPKRLGGRYFRGNDERDARLFNGGFYRTATIDLHLVDQQGQRKQWEDSIQEPLFVEIEIRRARQATKELFSSRVHRSVVLQHFCQTDGQSDRHAFDQLKEFDWWRARIPLATSDRWRDGRRLEGMIYLMYGQQIGLDNPRPHFAVRYDLILENGKISTASELWMGNLFTLAGRVLVPHRGEVLLDRWFDWRPIPEIEGAASTDPELLGLPEHAN